LLNKLFHQIFGFKDGQRFYFHLSNAGSCEVSYQTEDHRWYMLSMDARNGRQQPYKNPLEDLRIVLLRHAESEGNRQRLFQGQAETPLTETGRRQASLAGQSLRQQGYQFHSITASPQERAHQTALAIADHFDLSVQRDGRLKEIDNGRMAGMNGEQIDARFPIRTDRQNPYLPVGETGESWFELYLRAGEVVESLASRPPGEYLIVSHGAFLNSMLCSILGIVPQPSSRPGLFHFGNTGFADLAYHKSLDRWTLLSLHPGASQEE
jgi:broad specificity phosphatase PhoE